MENEKYFYVIYKIVNKLNNKFYIGAHKTSDLNDGYMGSGLRIKYAIEKYGVDNFEKQYLYYLDSEELMYDKEKELVNEELLANEECYNIVLGGKGGFSFIKNNQDLYEKWKLAVAIGKQQVNYDEWKKAHIIGMSKIDRKKIGEKTSLILKEYYKDKNNHPFFGKKHSEETLKRLRKSKNQGESNSQFGTCWVYNDKESLRIKKEELDNYLNQGWNKGRKMKI